MKRILFLVLFMGLTLTSFAQQSEDNPNSVYEKFSLAYKMRDAQILSECYVEDAAVLNLYDSSPPNSIKGVQNIVAFFNGFFKRSKEQQLQIDLSFKIIDRQKIDDIYYDNGFYKLIYTDSEGGQRVGYGKLSTIIKWDDDQWKFMVDANCNTEEKEFLNATVGDIPQPK